MADLRVDVFRHLARLGIDFFDRTQSGEIVSRLTADTTQIKAAAGANVSIALRNIILFIGAIGHDGGDEPAPVGAGAGRASRSIVLPLVGFGRSVRGRSRAAQDTLADASAYASEAIGAVRTVQAFTAGGAVTGPLRRRRRRRLRGRPRLDRRARAS